jgi:UDPglucose 6-dehydrogenase
VKVAVLGLWHLGSVTAACLAAAGHEVRAFDPVGATIEALRDGRPPIAEPGLQDLIGRGLRSGALRFTSDAGEAIRDAEVVWVTFDTPVDAGDRADVASVVAHVEAAFPHLTDGALLMVSSQLPVGTLRRLEESWRAAARGRRVSFACSPENLRLGDAIEVFMKPDRVIVGVRDGSARERATRLFAPITDRIEWMSIESAEMTKHAVNAFLGTSVTFINELAAICERVGADAKEVERGLRSERRIGPLAYLSPGGAFAGGTLARDVTFLRELGLAHDVPTGLLDGVVASNTAHQRWARRRLESELGRLEGIRVAVWGLAYKPGTDTLRGSPSLDLCRWLVGRGADVHVHDPAIVALPGDLDDVTCHTDPLDAATGARALVVGTSWPIYRQVDVDRLAASAPGLLVLDANRFLGPLLGGDSRFRTIGVGQPSR